MPQFFKFDNFLIIFITEKKLDYLLKNINY